MKKINNPNIILTGLPRSGTTLSCFLLNKLTNTIAVNEPMEVDFAKEKTKKQICNEINNFFFSSRQSILQNKKVLTKHINGKVPDNSYGSERNIYGLRLNNTDRSFIEIESDVDVDFTLCIKHNGLFTLLLEELDPLFSCYAIIRNPLAILASWNSVDMPVNKGHIPVAENIDQALCHKLNTISDRFDRQFYILSWFFQQYRQSLSRERVIRYEDIISSGGTALKIIVPEAIKLYEPLSNILIFGNNYQYSFI